MFFLMAEPTQIDRLETARKSLSCAVGEGREREGMVKHCRAREEGAQMIDSWLTDDSSFDG